MSASLTLNLLAMLAARFFPAVFSFAIHVALARVAGADTLGAYASLLAVLMIFQAVTGAGMQYYVSREIAVARERAPDLLRQGRLFGLATGVIGTVVYWAYAAAVLPAHRLLPATVLGLALLPSTWIAIQEAVFIGTRTHHWIAAIGMLENVVKLMGAGLALASGQGLFGVCVAIAVSRWLALVLGAVLVGRLGLGTAVPASAASGWMFAKTLAPFSMAFMLSMAYFRVDLPLVQAVAGESAAGVYGAAAALYGALLLLPDSALSAVYPRLALAFHTSRDGYTQAMWLAAKLLILTLVPLAIVLIASSDWILARIYGPAFISAGPVLRLLALALPLHAVNGAIGQALQGGGEQSGMVGVVAVGLSIHLILTTVLIHRIGISGAAIGMIVSSLVVLGGALYMVHTRLSPVRIGRAAMPMVGAVVGPLALVTFAPAEVRGIAGMGAAVAFVCVSRWCRVLADAEWAGVRAAIGLAGPGPGRAAA